MAVVPQRPVLLQGTVAFNLDPSGCASESELLSVLRDVNVLHILQQHAAQHATAPAAPQRATAALRSCTPQGESDVSQPLLAEQNATDRSEEDALASAVLHLEVGARPCRLPAAAQQQLCVARALLQRPLCASSSSACAQSVSGVTSLGLCMPSSYCKQAGSSSGPSMLPAPVTQAMLRPQDNWEVDIIPLVQRAVPGRDRGAPEHR